MRHRIRIWFTATLVLPAALLATPSPATASVGGCSANWSGHGYTIGVCVNDRNTTTMAFPDIYVNSSAGTASCSISIEVWNGSNQRFSNKSVSCAAGHYNGYATGPFWSDTPVHAFARLMLNGHPYATVDSPVITLSSNGTVLYNQDIPIEVPFGGRAPIKGHSADVFALLHTCFNCTFPVPGAPASYPADDQVLPLQVCLLGICHINAPVRAYTDEPVGDFMVVAQQGHFDTPGSAVRFHFTADGSGYLHLQVEAFVISSTEPDAVNRAGALTMWNNFADNIGRDLFLRCGAVCS